ncbi:protein tyrosine phosphatase type IVA 3 isoform X1 [Manis pentadactyla]|uniref:protein tyrosine phosphatase type IVA 3 isoform X1 n=1 Tax=Manis pentadactyla TaxID=143292 RepID=UPI00255C56A9|nr:protein tyrosine phosphatase type IVA 3 isoform X1 [Manis pentadactyla]
MEAAAARAGVSFSPGLGPVEASPAGPSGAPAALQRLPGPRPVSGRTMARMNRPAPVEVSYKNMRFLITHNPTNATLSTFIEDLKKYGATTVVRVCEVTYDKAPLEKDGITVVDWPFDDGAPPPGKVVEDWLSLLKAKFCDDPGSCVAVHCVAGLGRAPVLVALALIESGMKYEDAIQFIRQKRRGAINSRQLTYLEKYRPKQRLRFKDPHTHKAKCCVM